MMKKKKQVDGRKANTFVYIIKAEKSIFPIKVQIEN